MAMSTENLMVLAQEALGNEDKAVELMTRLRWPNGVCCPRCGCLDPYRLTPKAQGTRPARKGLYKCSGCKKQFSVTTGSVFEASHLPLSKWLMAIHLMSASKKGMSAHQLHRMIGCTYRAAWFAMHRLRYAMATNADLFSKLMGTVEVDETYIGGKQKGPFATARRYKNKTAVMALVERKGRVRAFPLESQHGNKMQDAVRANVHWSADMMSDDHRGYQALNMGFKSHNTIKHSLGEYVRGNVHTNTVEGFFSLLKRGIVGTFHHVSKGHLHRYCDEFAFRYNTRTALGYTDGARAAALVLGAEGKRLTYEKREDSGAA